MKIFYDSKCPVCSKEIKLLKFIDKKKKVEYIDFTERSFKPEKYGKKINDFEKEINGMNDNGEWVDGMDVFRLVYSKIGLGFLVNWTALPGFKQIFDLLYKGFAKIRPFFSKFKSEETSKCAKK